MMESQQVKDVELLKALYFGNHLSKEELGRAVNVVYGVSHALKERIKGGVCYA